MLILTRRVGESILIGQDIEVAVLGLKGNQVRIGIRAPTGVPVHREELLTRGKSGESHQGGQAVGQSQDGKDRRSA